MPRQPKFLPLRSASEPTLHPEMGPSPSWPCANLSTLSPQPDYVTGTTLHSLLPSNFSNSPKAGLQPSRCFILVTLSYIREEEAVSAHLQGVNFSKRQQLELFRSLRGYRANGAEWNQWASRPESSSKALFDLEQMNSMWYICYFPGTKPGSIETCFLEENSSRALKMTSYIHTGGCGNLTLCISPTRVISFCLYLCVLQKSI